MTLRAQTALLVRGSRAWQRWRGPRPPGPPDPPRCPAGWHTGPPHYVGLGAQKAGTSWWDALIGRHPSVVRATGLPKELHFFDQAWEEPFGEADAARYARLLPAAGGRRDGRVDARLPHRLLDARAAGPGRAGGPHPRPAARPHRALPLRPQPPAGDLARAARRTATSRAPSSAASTHRSCGACWTPSRPSRSSSASTRPAGPTPPASWRGRSRSWAWRPSSRTRPPTGARSTPPPGRASSRRRACVEPCVDGYAPDLEQLTSLVPGLDLSLWPTAREVGLA